MVCTRSGIGNELLVDGENCLLVDYRSVEETYAALTKVISDPLVRSSVVANGRKSSMRYARTSDLNTLEFLYGSGA